MNFLDLVNMRHSVRNYETRAVEKKIGLCAGMCTLVSFGREFSALEICRSH